MIFNVQVKGIKEAQQLLKEFADGSSNLSASLIAIATQFVEDCQADAPVDTGYLRDNIAITETAPDHITVESSAPYSGFVDAGSRYQEPQPFFSGNVERLLSSSEHSEISDSLIEHWNNLVNRLSA